MPEFPLEASIPQLQRAMETGQLTSAELVGFYLARIAAYDRAGPELNALISVSSSAGDDAAALDAERVASGPRGPLHGIPVVLKDNINTTSLPTTAGSLALDGFRPADDAALVQRLSHAGAVILGKANLFDFAFGWETASSLGGQTRNPYDPTRDPGGSSGGTAAAVAANLAAVGLGSDTCGSIRLPAAHCNLYGMRPTDGLSSRDGVIPVSPTLDTVGPIARTVIDLAVVLDIILGLDTGDPTTSPKRVAFSDAVDADGLTGRRIGVVPFEVETAVEAILTESLADMQAIGADLSSVLLPRLPVNAFVFLEEFRFAIDDYLAARPEAPVGSLADIVALNIAHPVSARLRRAAAVVTLETDAYHAALAARRQLRDAVESLMDEHDLDAIAYPASRQPAALIGSAQKPFDCQTAALAGLPSIVIPAGFTAEGLPVGLELLAKAFQEPTLIAIASGFEAHTRRRMLPPSTPAL